MIGVARCLPKRTRARRGRALLSSLTRVSASSFASFGSFPRFRRSHFCSSSLSPSVSPSSSSSPPPSPSASSKPSSAQLAPDHRTIGKRLDYFMFHDYSPGSAFFLPHGTTLYNSLVDFLRGQYRARGYQEVRSPLLYDKALWERSGHWQNYKENMYLVRGAGEEEDEKGGGDGGREGEGQGEGEAAAAAGVDGTRPKAAAEDEADDDNLMASEEAAAMQLAQPTGCYGLKPMNCPGHCLIFRSVRRSFRDLPLRLADFSALHRNEVSGALTGLTRVRNFHQDDAHIFCQPDQVQREILGCLEFVRDVYAEFGFSFSLKLSTRPDKYTGTLDQWTQAEDALRSALDHFTGQAERQGQHEHQRVGGKEEGEKKTQKKKEKKKKKDETGGTVPTSWTVDEGDGAFYGPKVDVSVHDALQRVHQCATIQLDFQLPERLALRYQNSANEFLRPVMVHRAIYGSLERFIALLLEHSLGWLPFWCSPRQVLVVTVGAVGGGGASDDCDPAAEQERKQLVDYAAQVTRSLWAAGVRVAQAPVSEHLRAAVKRGTAERYFFVLVLGKNEVGQRSVTVRRRKQVTPSVPLDRFVRLCEELATRQQPPIDSAAAEGDDGGDVLPSQEHKPGHFTARRSEEAVLAEFEAEHKRQ